MAYTLNMFEERWDKNMRQLFEKAPYDKQSFVEAINLLKELYKQNSQSQIVKSYIGQFRRIMWPQAEQNLVSMNMILPETFDELKSNYEKFKNASLNGPKQEN